MIDLVTLPDIRSVILSKLTNIDFSSGLSTGQTKT